MKKLYYLSIFLFLISIVCDAQQKVKIEKADFKLEKPGYELAWQSIKEGDKCYTLGGGLYVKAAEFYSEAIEFNPENAALNYKLGVSCLFGNDQQGALPYFLKARIINMDIADDLVLLTGRAYQFRGDYGKAIDCYNMYSDNGLENGKIDPVVNDYINECNMAIEYGVAETNLLIENLGDMINSDQDDYSSILVKDEQVIYFTTRRKTDEKDRVQNMDMKFNENVFLATGGPDNWIDGGPAGEELATEMNEGVLFVDNDNTTMYVYAGWSRNGDILVSVFENGSWTSPTDFQDDLSSPYRETSVALTPDRKQIYFTSDRRSGSFGGRDIYFMRHIKKNKWTKPMNLGPLVNSSANEEGVWTSATGDTIWYSSNGIKGFGSYDIFMSVRDETGIFSEPVNLGMPINSQWNDLFYRPSVIDRRVSWFSSDRPGGFGGLDIYRVTKLPIENLVPPTEKIEFLP